MFEFHAPPLIVGGPRAGSMREVKQRRKRCLYLTQTNRHAYQRAQACGAHLRAAAKLNFNLFKGC